jgi:hypothetical protein
VRTWRIALSTAGILLGLFGVFRLFTEAPFTHLLLLLLWLVAAVAIHDGVLSPLVVGVGWLLAKTVPPRARRFLQGGLIAGGLITVVAIPMMLRQGLDPPAKALLLQDFRVNLAYLLAVVATICLLLYALAVARKDAVRSMVGRLGPGS